MNTDRLFVYGTLLLGENEHGRFLQKRGMRIGAGHIPGQIFDIGGYPGLIYRPESPDLVIGSVFEVPSTPSFWRFLDEYEGIHENEPEYSRDLLPVLVNGSWLDCYVYLFGLDIQDRLPVEGGDYLRYLGHPVTGTAGAGENL